jgi:hypothetical protein
MTSQRSIRSQERSMRNQGSIWPLDVALGLLGLLVLTMVIRLLRFDDPRWLYNAWSYFLGVPTVLIAASMVARVLFSEQMERSIQIGFLISVATHLLLTIFAVNLILFTGVWREARESTERRIQSESRAPQFATMPRETTEPRPDYLRPVPIEFTQPTETEVKASLPEDAPLALSQPEMESIPPSVPEPLAPTQAPRKLEEPKIASIEMPRERPKRSLSPPPKGSQIELPAMPAPTSEDPVAMALEAVGMQANRTEDPRVSRVQEPPPTSLPFPQPASDVMDARDVEQRLAVSQDTMATRMPQRSVTLPGPDRFSQVESPNRHTYAERIQPKRATAPISVPEVLANDTSEVGATMASDTASLASSHLDRTSGTGRSADVQQAIDLRSTIDGTSELGSIPSANTMASEANASQESPIAGSSSRMAPPPAPSLQPSLDALAGPELNRFRRRDVGANSTSRTQVPIPSSAFQQRIRRNEEAMAEELQDMGSLGPQTEEAIELGLEFLAKHQREDGSWRLEDFGDRPQLRSDTAATALSLLAFQGAGYSHQQFKYQASCRKAIDWLTSVQSAQGDLYRAMDEASDRNAWLYSHAIATLALCEAFGMTQDETLREAAQRAVDFLTASQDPIAGGWRYAPRVGSDTSVTGWAMMALKSAELSGLNVSTSTYQGIERWLDRSEASARERYLYRYNWQANTPETQHGRIPTPVMTSVGLLMRMYLGWRRTDPEMVQGTDWLLQRPPSLGTPQAPLRDTYYWYYASQVMFHMGGQRWREWYNALYPILIESQERKGELAGSWDPAGEIPDAWGPYAGRLYVTTMNLLSLEVTYRHLPIYGWPQ